METHKPNHALDSDEPEATATASWVAKLLRDRIVKGELPPLARIVERRLSAELNVSRTPIREALKLLQSDGLIEISRNRGAQVTAYKASEAKQLFDVIAMLESLAARRLTETIDAPTLDLFEDLHAQMMVFHKIGSAADYFDVNTEIHDLIVSRCGNPVLENTHRRLIAQARRGRYLAIMDPKRLAQAVQEHEILMDAFRAQDAEAAAAIWHDHLMNTGMSVSDVLKKGAD